jgi:hypothetical protein
MAGFLRNREGWMSASIIDDEVKARGESPRFSSLPNSTPGSKHRFQGKSRKTENVSMEPISDFGENARDRGFTMASRRRSIATCVRSTRLVIFHVKLGKVFRR